MRTKTFGSSGEEFACRLLQKSGYRVLEKNFRSKLGEIDIVCLQRGILVFVEVKTRHSYKYGKPEEAVTPYKLKKIARVADYYLMLHPELPRKVRIDVVALTVQNGSISDAKIIKVI